MCKACERALTQLHGEYWANCRGCFVRSLASAPQAIRKQAYLAVTDENERKTLKRDVSDEWKRIKALLEAGA